MALQLAPIFLLVLFGIFKQPDGSFEPVISAYAEIKGEDGTLHKFTSKDECEAAYAKIETVAKSDPDEIFAIGHSCDEIDPEVTGRQASNVTPNAGTASLNTGAPD